jgi:hypothetical protein
MLNISAEGGESNKGIHEKTINFKIRAQVADFLLALTAQSE